VLRAIKENMSHCLKRQLGLKIDDLGILRCYGRFLNATITDSAKHPKLLPRREHLTSLLITEVHQRLIHAGVSHTLAQLREEYWIPQGRAEVRSVLSQCSLCRRLEGPPFRLPCMPPWPKERVSRSDPFQFVGLDYLGPVNVKWESELKKTWICLFTCLSIRAIHLEWVLDLSASQFLNCLRRFVSRRGRPDVIILDNAPQFKLVHTVVDREWRRIFQDKEVMSYVSTEGIKWKYTIALAPWQGSFYERLVGLVKRCMRKSIGKKHYSLEQLATLLTEIEAVLNSRPLTYVYEVYCSFTLTPGHFLAANRKLGLCNSSEVDSHFDEDFQPNKDSATKLITIWKKGQKQLDLFWNVWQKDYLFSLREKLPLEHRHPRSQCHMEPKEGSIVIVKDNHLPRSNWKLGRIIRLIPSSDSRIRAAEVLLPGRSVVSRAINCLFPLELPDKPVSKHHTKEDLSEIDVLSKENFASNDNEDRNGREKRQRKASIEARKIIYNSLEHDCCTALFCVPRECHRDSTISWT